MWVAFLTVENASAYGTVNTGWNACFKSDRTKEIHVMVQGMYCQACSYKLEKQFKKIAGIENLTSDYKTGLITFRMMPGKTVSDEEIKKLVKDAGYAVREIKHVDVPAKAEKK